MLDIRALPREIILISAFVGMCLQIMQVHDGTTLPRDTLGWVSLLSLAGGGMLAANLAIWGRRGSEVALMIAGRDTDRLRGIAGELEDKRRGNHPDIQSAVLFAGFALAYGNLIVCLALVMALIYFQQVVGQRIQEIRDCADNIR